MDKGSNNIKIETRSFKEIWASLDPESQQSDLRRRLIQCQVCGTAQTVWNWGAGKSSPTNTVVINTVERVVSEFLSTVNGKKTKCLPGALFRTR